jgi:hypothetical protein
MAAVAAFLNFHGYHRKKDFKIGTYGKNFFS